MSDNFLRFIPTNAGFVPSQSAMDKAFEQFKASFLPDCSVKMQVFDKIRFIDPGSSLERIVCPNCAAEIDMDFWGQAMGNAHQNGFEDLSVSTPCCGSMTSLNSLHYIWPAGFATFMLEALKPDTDLDDLQIRSIEQILQTPLRKIWAHY